MVEGGRQLVKTGIQTVVREWETFGREKETAARGGRQLIWRGGRQLEEGESR